MNLVAKEYVAAQAPDNPGVLVLSQFAGAAHELKCALIVNPYDIEATAAAIAHAYAMPLEERKDRWNALMAVLRGNSIHDWTAHFLQALGNEHEGREIEDARLPATIGLRRTLPLPARLGGIRGAHL
jgi:trehalose 6-phosphate synthase